MSWQDEPHGVRGLHSDPVQNGGKENEQSKKCSKKLGTRESGC